MWRIAIPHRDFSRVSVSRHREARVFNVICLSRDRLAIGHHLPGLILLKLSGHLFFNPIREKTDRELRPNPKREESRPFPIPPPAFSLSPQAFSLVNTPREVVIVKSVNSAALTNLRRLTTQPGLYAITQARCRRRHCTSLTDASPGVCWAGG